MAKLSGLRKTVTALMNDNVSRRRSSGEVKTRADGGHRLSLSANAVCAY
jgi:hypothetical protein